MTAESTGTEEVFRRAARGDRSAFGDLVREHQAMVFGMLLHFTRDRAVAEELAQEVFLGLHQAIGRLECSAHVVSWLRRAAMHRCIDHARRERLRPRIALDDLPEPSVNARVGDPFLAEAVRKAVAALPAKARSVVLLRFQEEMELTEIASTLEIPLNTVKSALHRALATMRRKLALENVNS